ncbi:uncharacterized protein MCYG_02507 [Microsporum canis CBS 113480]|uniref:Uncharacterized protein n=1 Tax=Arthroderma otae (strain ATCC MYA-4605 / CBS 113480) TaxID=554155 RepID=C5FG03_ARTOC|nr:uncharacterized protein MCYG_02507 [Microsporum canis CBS 113480]EEQ29688.1 hypothetical protein MCYG_02507 [Microsporum canis CBS 113480]
MKVDDLEDEKEKKLYKKRAKEGRMIRLPKDLMIDDDFIPVYFGRGGRGPVGGGPGQGGNCVAYPAIAKMAVYNVFGVKVCGVMINRFGKDWLDEMEDGLYIINNGLRRVEDLVKM